MMRPAGGKWVVSSKQEWAGTAKNIPQLDALNRRNQSNNYKDMDVSPALCCNMTKYKPSKKISRGQSLVSIKKRGCPFPDTTVRALPRVLL